MSTSAVHAYPLGADGWTRVLGPGRADVRGPTLLCLPSSGCSASYFGPWCRHTALPLAAVQLPGRENRFREPPVSDLDELVDALAPRLAALRVDYALIGHSMGALLAYAVTRRLHATGAALPRRLFVVGAPAPHLPVGKPAYLLDRERLIDWLTALGGLPAEAREISQLLNCMLPTVRADLTVSGTYRHRPGPVLPVPIRAFVGVDDPACPVPDAAAWRCHTSAGFALTRIGGGHFPSPDGVARILGQAETDLATPETPEEMG